MLRLNILILYGANATFTSTVMEHLRSYAMYSRHHVRFASIAPFDFGTFPDLAAFDVVVLHYSFFPGLHWVMPGQLARCLADYQGLKILYLQDEYDHTDIARSWIEWLHIGCVCTCVPEKYVELVYPRSRFPNVDFRQTLTGYVPFSRIDAPLIPLPERPIFIGYRGRVLHPRYGDLAREKSLIGERMRAICLERGIKVDIECAENKRIYGRAWYEFLADCRATLGTESGSNVFDENGELRKAVDAALCAEPELSYETIHARFLANREGRICMNQVSPRIFEAIAVRTALVLFEGNYSGIVRPWEHYLPLRKDFSNVDEILRKLEDTPAVEAMIERAYREVIQSGKFSYETFVHDFDAYVGSRVKPNRVNAPPATVITAPAQDESESKSFLKIAPCTLTNLPIRVEWLIPDPPVAPEKPSSALAKIRAVFARLIRRPV
jgi:hypothetical protein